MILRKPYAFFIKYFRIINLIIAVFMTFLVYRISKLVSFLNEYVSNYSSAMANFTMSDIINSYMFLFSLIIIIGNIIILSVLIIKEKPKKLYIFNLVLYTSIIILLFIDYSSLRDITNTIMDIRESKALRDITLGFLILQVVSLILTMVRVLGFDIKKFDFNTDLQKLDINIKDNEEFEVAVELDTNKTKRNIRKTIRESRYFYQEHNFIINTVIIIIIIIITFLTIYNKMIYVSNYSENHPFTASNVSLNILSSYVIETDKDGNKLDEALVVIKLEVKSSIEDSILNTGLFNLRIGKTSYNITQAYNSQIDDIGTSYIDQALTENYTPYIIAFKIKKEDINKQKILKFNDNVSYVKGQIGAKNIYIKLNPIDLTKITKQKYVIGDTIDFTGSLLENSSLTIEDIDISRKFKLEYNFCSKSNNCYTSSEYLTPTTTGNYFKTLLKIEGNFKEDENINIENIQDIRYLLNQYGTIYYQINGVWSHHKINSQYIKPNVASLKNVTYIEVNREIEQAEKIYLQLNVRNYKYKYDLR